MHDGGWNAQKLTQAPYFVLVQLLERFNEFPGGTFGLYKGGTDVMMTLDYLSFISDALPRFDQVGVQGTLGQKVAFRQKPGDFFLLNPDKCIPDDSALFFRIFDSVKRFQESLPGIDQ